MLSLVLPNIRSAHNVGAIFRTAEALGAAKIYLAGYTPAPVDQFGRANSTIAKTALGAEKILAWEKFEDIVALLEQLKRERFQLIALEQAPGAVDYRALKIGEKTAVILGNEVEGLPPEVLSLCDVVAEIPMRGQKESLNVSVAAGIALSRWLE